MNKQLNVINDLINKLSTRERILVLTGFLAVIYIAWDTFLITPIIKANTALNMQFQTIKQQMSDLEKRHVIASDLLAQSRRKQLVREIGQVEQKINNFNSQISQRLQGRVAPEEMAGLLNDVLQKNHKLELIQINNLEAEPFITQNKTDQKESIDPDLVGIYRHSMEMELQGAYLDILDYLQELEALQWKIFWDDVKMDVQEYPVVRVNIKVHTFSLKDGWLSV